MPGLSGITLAAARKKQAKARAAKSARRSGDHENEDDEDEWEDIADEDDQHELSSSSACPAVYFGKKKKKKKRPEMEAAAAYAASKDVATVLPSLPQKMFSSFDEADECIATHCADTNSSMTTRSSHSRQWKNSKLQEQYDRNKGLAEALGEEFTDELHLLPLDFSHYQKFYKCVHAEYQPDRVPVDARQRYQASTRYTGCQARVTVEARRVEIDKEWVWRVIARQEHTIHNHACTDAVFQSYQTHSLIDDDDLFQRVASQIRVGGNSRQIRDQISDEICTNFSSTQFNNFKNYRLGGGDALDNLERLLELFTAVEGNRCVVLHDQNDMIIGIILQTAIQRQLFRRYGDSLLLDWTHNTNNVGFYAGCLMGTSVTGKGIPLLNFLCVSQGYDMMRTVLEVFAEGCEDAADIIESFVIDKDYKEWKAVSTVFANTKVVLCQFHVLKWFKSVVADSRHGISLSQRPEVLLVVRRMVYAESSDDFERYKAQLQSLLPAETHPSFQDYMDKRWFSCENMWANYARGKAFTAGNTTTNRLESHWNQFKAALGKNRRIDRCVEAILVRGTAILRRELAEIVNATASTRLFPNEHIFLRGLLRDLSDSRAALVRGQWIKYIARSEKYYTPEGLEADGSCSVFTSRSSGVRFKAETRSARHWNCSCRFATSHRLPCRHQFFVAERVQGLTSYPLHALARRWSMSAAADLISPLREAAEWLGGVRLHKVLVRRSAPHVPRAEVTVQLRRPQKVTYRQLRRYERAGRVVLGAIEKKNIVQGQCERVVHALMSLGTVAFWDASERLEQVLSDFVSSLSSSDSNDSHDESAETREPSRPANTVPMSNTSSVRPTVPERGTGLRGGSKVDAVIGVSTTTALRVRPLDGNTASTGVVNDRVSKQKRKCQASRPILSDPPNLVRGEEVLENVCNHDNDWHKRRAERAKKARLVREATADEDWLATQSQFKLLPTAETTPIHPPVPPLPNRAESKQTRWWSRRSQNPSIRPNGTTNARKERKRHESHRKPRWTNYQR